MYVCVHAHALRQSLVLKLTSSVLNCSLPHLFVESFDCQLGAGAVYDFNLRGWKVTLWNALCQQAQ